MVRRMLRRVVGMALLVLVIGRTAAAQDLLTITGEVTTRADGLSVPDAVVSVVDSDASARTDASGRYTLQCRARSCGAIGSS